MEKRDVIITKTLEPGMALAEDLLDVNSGAVLLKEGTVINEKMLQSVLLFSHKDKYAVYLDSTREPFKKAKTVEIPQIKNEQPKTGGFSSHYFEVGKKIDIENHMRPLPERISKEAQDVYLDGLNTIKNFYEKPELITHEDIMGTVATAERIMEEVIRDPQILLQVSVLKAFDNYTFAHAVHVAIYASTLANYLGFSQSDIKEICLAGLLHDIGKVDVPREILNKPGPLDPDEYNVVKEHVRHSYRRLYKFENLNKDVMSAIYQHHERMDGTGYPEGISGEEIHKWSRIIAIADVYDAVTTDRIYHKSMLPHVGAEIIMGSVGKLDHDYIVAFFQNMPIYPLGSKVKLSTGEIGVVTASLPRLHIRPIVHIINDNNEITRTAYLNEEFTTFIVEILHE